MRELHLQHSSLLVVQYSIDEEPTTVISMHVITRKCLHYFLDILEQRLDIGAKY